MALSTRELYLVLKARDEASRAVRNFGSNMTKLGQLERRLNAASARSAAQVAAARRKAAQAAIRADEARQAKAAAVAARQVELDRIQAESAAKMTASKSRQAVAQSRIDRVRLEKSIAIARKQMIIDREMEKSAKKRNVRVIESAQKEILAISRTAEAAVLNARKIVLSEKEIRLAIAQTDVARVKSAQQAVAAARTQGDAAIRRAQREELAARQSIAAAKAAGAAQIASIRGAMRAETARATAARQRLNVGNAAMTGGVTAAAIGAIGIAALNNMANAAAKYNEQVARVKTQTDNVKVSMAQLRQMGLKASSDLAVKFDQVQPALYDIFSSIEINAPQAGKLLRQIGKDAVGGSVDMETAGQVNIGILNAYKLEAKDAAHVSDVLFQLVRKGVGTYKQFGSTIGRAVPSAIKANQSLESLSGIMAFLTRNGLSAAMAAASAGRALDALANPKSVAAFNDFGKKAIGAIKMLGGPSAKKTLDGLGDGFKKMSVKILDASGDVKPVTEIIHDLNKAFKGFTKEQKAATMQELFKGSGGTIQAMRFFNHAVNDGNDLLGTLTKYMHNAGGAAEEAYKTMSNTPEAKIQILKNRFNELRVTIGQYLIPIKLKLVTIIGKVVGWFNKLSPGIKKTIAQFSAIAAVTAVVLGVLAILIGLFMTLSAGLTLVVGGLLPAIAAFAEFAAVAAGIYFLIKYSEDIKRIVAPAWEGLKDIFQVLKNAWDSFYPVFIGGVRRIFAAFSDAFRSLSQGDGVKKFFEGLKTIVQTAMDVIVPVVKLGWYVVTVTIANAIRVLGPLLNGLGIAFGVVATVLSAIPKPVYLVIAALALLVFATRNTAYSAAFIQLWSTNVKTALTRTAAAAKAAGSMFMAALAGFAIGSMISDLTKNSSTGVKALGALGSAAAGALAGMAIGGPMGAAFGALGGLLGSVVGSFNQVSAAEKRAMEITKIHAELVDDLTEAYKTSNGFITTKAYDDIYEALRKLGAIDAAKALGIKDLSLLPKAVTGDSGALSQLTTGLGDVYKQYQKMDKAALADGWKKGIHSLIESFPEKVPAAIRSFDTLYRAVTAGSKDVNEAKKRWQDYKNATKDAADASDRLNDSLSALNGSLSGQQALDSYKLAVKNLATSLDAQNKSLVGNSTAALQNRVAIQGVVQQALQYGATLRDQGKSAPVVGKAIQQQIQYLLNNAKALGLNRRQLVQYLTKLKLMPKDVRAGIDVNYGKAVKGVNKVQASLNSLRQDKTLSVDVSTGKGKAAVDSLQAIINRLKQGKIPGVTIDNAKGKALTRDVQAAINAIRQGHVPSVDLHGAASIATLRAIQSYLDNLRDKTITVTTNSVSKNIKAGQSTAGHNASNAIGGTLRNGLTLINERGPELLEKRGNIVRVVTNNDTKRMFRGRDNGPIADAKRGMSSFAMAAKGTKGAAQHVKKPKHPLGHALDVGKIQTVADKTPPRNTKGASYDDLHDYMYRGKRYGTKESANNAVKAFKEKVKALKQAIKSTKIPNLRYGITTASAKSIKSKVQSLAKDVAKFGDKYLNEEIGKKGIRLRELANKRDQKQRALAKAEGRLSNLQSKRANLKNTIKESVTSTFNFGEEQGSFKDIAGDLHQRVADARKFVKSISKLKKKGYSTAVIASLYQQGPAALPVIEEMLKASKAQVNSFNRDFRNLNTLGTQAGESVAGSMYDAGINAAKGLIKGLKDRIKQIKNTMVQVADAMVAVIKRRLGIKSPSRVMAGIGGNMMKGLHKGLDKGYGDVSNLMANKAKDMSGYFEDVGNPLDRVKSRSAAGDTIGRDSSRGGVVFEAGAIPIYTQEIDPTKHAADLGWAIGRRVN